MPFCLFPALARGMQAVGNIRCKIVYPITRVRGNGANLPGNGEEISFHIIVFYVLAYLDELFLLSSGYYR